MNALQVELERVRANADCERQEAARERQEFRDRFAPLERRSVSPRIAPPAPFLQITLSPDPLTTHRSSGGGPVVSGPTHYRFLQDAGSLAPALVIPPAGYTAPRTPSPVPSPVSPPVVIPPVQSGLVVSSDYNQRTQQYGVRHTRFQSPDPQPINSAFSPCPTVRGGL